MANGRLGSAKLTPVSAALLYSNTSGSQAVINIQATALSSTTNANIALAIDSATVSLNQTTAATAISSGNITQDIYNLDPLSSNRPIKYEFFDNYNESNSTAYPASYWNGSSWFKPSTGFYGAPNMQKIDPYFITTPSAYGKAEANHAILWRYNTTSSVLRARYYNLATMTGAQFANTQQFADPGTSYTGSQDFSYAGFGWSIDPYTNYFIGVGDSGYMQSAQVGASVGNTGSFTSNSTMYNFYTSNYTNLPHYWYAPRIMGSNGLFIMQPTGNSDSRFTIADIELATSLGNSAYAFYWQGATATTAWWYMNAPNTASAQVGWFEYNPNDQRYYFEYIPAGSGRGIYSFTRAGLLALTSRGTSGGYNFSSAGFTNHGTPPWTTSPVTRPLRVGASLWWTYSSNGNAYTSTDLKTWTLASTYYPSLGYAANTFNTAPVSSTAYNYTQVSTANVSRFTSGYSNVSQTAVLEFNTSISNYQRTGILLSNGDKLYAQNYGSVDFSATVMGYEG